MLIFLNIVCCKLSSRARTVSQGLLVTRLSYNPVHVSHYTKLEIENLLFDDLSKTKILHVYTCICTVDNFLHQCYGKGVITWFYLGGKGWKKCDVIALKSEQMK